MKSLKLLHTSALLLGSSLLTFTGCANAEPPPSSAAPAPGNSASGRPAAEPQEAAESKSPAPDAAAEMARQWSSIAGSKEKLAKLFPGQKPSVLRVVAGLMREFEIDKDSVNIEPDAASTRVVMQRVVRGGCYVWQAGKELRASITPPADLASSGQPLATGDRDLRGLLKDLQADGSSLTKLRTAGGVPLPTLIGLTNAVQPWQSIVVSFKPQPRSLQRLEAVATESLPLELSLSWSQGKFQVTGMISIGGAPAAEFLASADKE